MVQGNLWGKPERVIKRINKESGIMKKGIFGFMALVTGVLGGAIGTGKYLNKKINVARTYSDKHLSLFLMMNQWVKVKQEGKNLAAYFEKNGYKNIAIYGMSYAGETLLEELRETQIQVVYGIDKNAENIYSDISILSLEDTLDDVDAIVVTAVTFFDEIEDELHKKVNCPILSLEDILYEV